MIRLHHGASCLGNEPASVSPSNRTLSSYQPFVDCCCVNWQSERRQARCSTSRPTRSATSSKNLVVALVDFHGRKPNVLLWGQKSKFAGATGSRGLCRTRNGFLSLIHLRPSRNGTRQSRTPKRCSKSGNDVTLRPSLNRSIFAPPKRSVPN